MVTRLPAFRWASELRGRELVARTIGRPVLWGRRCKVFLEKIQIGSWATNRSGSRFIPKILEKSVFLFLFLAFLS